MEQGLGSDANRPFSTSELSPLQILFCYSALVPVKNLTFSGPLNITFNVAHEFFLRKILLNPHLKQYPPSVSYQQRFWKWALDQLGGLVRSDEEDEIDECIYAHYLSLMNSAGSGTPPDSFITHYWKFPNAHGCTTEDSYKPITLLESRTTVEGGTTGLRTWRASRVLAQYLIQHHYLVDTSNVLELGSGAGFIGILVASLQLRAQATLPFDHQMASIYLTDVNSTVLARCHDNVRLPCNDSKFHRNIYFKLLDWLDSLSCQESLKSLFSKAKVDIVLGADIVFDPVLVPPLVKTISLSLSSGPTRLVLVALTVRNEETLMYFLGEIGKVLKAEEVAHDILLNIPDQVDAELEVKMFKITRA